MGIWVFEELRGAAVRRDPKDAELFRTEHTEEGEYAGTDALVREVLQNSIDAGGGPVKVRIAVHDPDDAPSEARLAYYFARLRAPLQARQINFHKSGAPWLPCRYLVCEDFGTRGLEGDIRLFRDPVPGDTPKEDFYWFWRNIGRSGKTGDDLGRWGLGKTVYRAASGVGCMLGITIRQSDHQRLVMGQAVLQIHEHDGKEYQPEGYWCGSQDANGLPLPISDDAEVTTFCREWHLTRQNEPGLSVVAPYIPEELRDDRILQAVAVHFFARIIRGELVVQVAGPLVGQVTLDQASIERACLRIDWNGPKRTKRHAPPPIGFARRCLTICPPVATAPLGVDGPPDFNNGALAPEETATARHQFNAGEMVSLRTRVNLPRREGESQEGHIDVYVQRRSDGARCDTYYVREGMTITKINSRAGLRGVQAMVIVDPGPMAELLGDTEGPAHEDWDKSAERPDTVWKNWKNKVDFARRIVDNLVEFLTPPMTQPDFDLLSEFFSIQRTRAAHPQPEPGEESDKEGRMKEITPRPKWFQITERAGGFTVRRNSRVPLPNQPALRVSAAYDVSRGNPLKNWSPIDFEYGDKNDTLRKTGCGIKAKKLDGNTVRLNIEDESFSFSVEGFDRHRDLFVRVDDISGTSDEDEQRT
jgi:hypothetical protein